MHRQEEQAMKFSAKQHRQMALRLQQRARRRRGMPRRKTLELARAFLALARLAEAAHMARGRPIAAANGHRLVAWPNARPMLNG
jgi:hypothetical protein